RTPDRNLDDFIDPPIYIQTWHSPKVDLSTFRFGLMFRVYDWVIYPGKRFYKYAILGDDICIADSKVAEVYLSTLKDLGVTISLPKSL
ncbi:hypothetical protein S245_070487, partial [Arachis hypogaea]